ncbi:hypothetical protein MHK_001425, partial [Candidatus Magnetomorum sp. HK-1]
VDGDALSLTVTSSNESIVAIDASHVTLCSQTCVTGGNINLTATNLVQNLTATILPVKDGVAGITITVCDSGLCANSSFTLTVTNVNISPVLSTISDTSIDEDSVNAAIGLTVVDADCEGRNVTLTVESSNLVLVPENSSNLSIETSGLFHTVNADTVVSLDLKVSPVSNLFGSTGITVTVVDADGASVSDF